MLTVSFSGKEEAQEFMKRGKYTMPMLLDIEQQVGDAYRVYGLPTLVIIDRQGIIRHAHSGSTEIPVQEIDDLLAEAGE